MQQCDINILTSEEGYDIAASNFKGDIGLTLHSIQLPLSNERMITIKSQFPRLMLLVDQLRKLSKASVPYDPERLVPPKMISTYEVPHTPEDFTAQQVLAEKPLNVHDHITKTIILPNGVASRLAGRGFEKMLQLRRRTGTNIRITKVGIDASLSIRGPPAKVAIALRLIRERSIE
ncbi:hypothetical protein TRVA0_005S03224 [Trichomonascus vanleenenianus]|uniref:KH domain-containing protein n=1 Tax=Trichomonascus vanleenenianus TaxID=2268995 RepID=UPI003EC9F83F